MATKKWFVAVEDGEMGPLGPNGLRKLVRSGEVLPGTMVRRADHEFPVRADYVRGLFDDGVAKEPGRPMMHGPFTSLKALGWCNAAAMAVWVAVGIVGMFAAWSQRSIALEIHGGVDRPLQDAAAPFLGLGEVPVIVLFFATGVMFSYWLWSARINLPHLIVARMRFTPGWVIGGWFVPPLNLLRPYQVIEEVDRLSAEAVADGDASVHAESQLLVPWWVCTLLLIVCIVVYQVLPRATAEQMGTVALVHLLASGATVLAAGFGAVVLLRISSLQERAHDSHAEPVKLHHVRRGNHQQSAIG